MEQGRQFPGIYAKALVNPRTGNMKNSNIALKSQDEKTAKAVAGVIGRFLKEKGLTLPHTQSLDLVGALCGHADWRSLSASLAAESEKTKHTPQRITRDEFLKRFKPVKNMFDENADFDGFAFGTRGPGYEYVQKVLATDPGRVWTLVDCEVTTWLTSGYHYVNREFYVITHVPAEPDVSYEMAFGHDDDDKLYLVRVTDEDGEEVMSQEVYASSQRDATEQLQSDIEESSEELRDDDKSVYVYVEEVRSR
jgi:hypothetical protein